MKDFIDTQYLNEAFPKGEVSVDPESRGETYQENRIRLSVIQGELRVTRDFNRTLLIEAQHDTELQAFIIGQFKVRFEN